MANDTTKCILLSIGTRSCNYNIYYYFIFLKIVLFGKNFGIWNKKTIDNDKKGKTKHNRIWKATKNLMLWHYEISHKKRALNKRAMTNLKILKTISPKDLRHQDAHGCVIIDINCEATNTNEPLYSLLLQTHFYLISTVQKSTLSTKRDPWVPLANPFFSTTLFLLSLQRACMHLLIHLALQIAQNSSSISLFPFSHSKLGGKFLVKRDKLVIFEDQIWGSKG